MKEKGISNFIRQRKKELRLGMQEVQRNRGSYDYRHVCINIYKNMDNKIKSRR